MSERPTDEILGEDDLPDEKPRANGAFRDARAKTRTWDRRFRSHLNRVRPGAGQPATVLARGKPDASLLAESWTVPDRSDPT